MEWGGENLAPLKALYRHTKIPPPALARMPKPHPVIDFLIQCFFMASGSRPEGLNGAQPVPFSEWRQVCDEVGYTDSSDRHFLISALQTLDQFYLKKKQDKMPKGKPQQPKKNSFRG